MIALIPARSGSRGIVGKNMRTLGGKSLVRLAVECALNADAHPVVSTDISELLVVPPHPDLYDINPIQRRFRDAQDDSPMLAVVQDAMQQIPGDDSDIWLLVQPTQPLRTPDHLREAVRLLRESQADSVVSVVELPRTHSPEMVLRLDGEEGAYLRDCSLWPWEYTPPDRSSEKAYLSWDMMPTRRQQAQWAFKRDGTVYAVFRRTLARYRNIYGNRAVPLIIPPEQSCELDTEQQWAEVEARFNKLHGHAHRSS